MKKLRWGVLSTAKIGLRKVIPAMQRGEYCSIDAIASRDFERAKQAAAELGIPRAYGSYEELLADDEIDAIYNPLPNHMHVPWSLRALAAGKHVLCEKPIGLSAAEGEQLLAAARGSGFLVTEAFMYRWHPQWQRAKALVCEGAIGRLTTIQTFFSFFNADPGNYRNKPECGGGALMDIGCYAISLSRWLFDAEPTRIMGRIEYDPRFQIDRTASAIVEFAGGTSSFVCSTQLSPHQRVQIAGDRGRIEIEIPFNAPPDKPCRLWLDGATKEEIVFPICDQYTLQGDGFSKCVLNGEQPPTLLDDAVANMRVIEAIVRSDRTGAWERP
jgi:predicted dehydrogenase